MRTRLALIALVMIAALAALAQRLPTPVQPPVAQPPATTVEGRIQQLESRIALLEQRITQLENPSPRPRLLH